MTLDSGQGLTADAQLKELQNKVQFHVRQASKHAKVKRSARGAAVAAIAQKKMAGVQRRRGEASHPKTNLQEVGELKDRAETSRRMCDAFKVSCRQPLSPFAGGAALAEGD
jgi:hypothetical protein